MFREYLICYTYCFVLDPETYFVMFDRDAHLAIKLYFANTIESCPKYSVSDFYCQHSL